VNTAGRSFQFGHLHNAGVGEAHGSVAIVLMQLAQRDDMLIEPECDFDSTAFKQAKHPGLTPRQTWEEIHRFGEDGLAHEEWCFQGCDLLDRPIVMPIRPVEQRDKRTSINDCGDHRAQILKDASDWKRGRQRQNPPVGGQRRGRRLTIETRRVLRAVPT
jgi:hypothetical protein